MKTLTKRLLAVCRTLGCALGLAVCTISGLALTSTVALAQSSAPPAATPTLTPTASGDTSFTGLAVTIGIILVLFYLWRRLRRQQAQYQPPSARRRDNYDAYNGGYDFRGDPSMGGYFPSHQERRGPGRRNNNNRPIGSDEPLDFNQDNTGRNMSQNNDTKSPAQLILPNDPNKKTFADVAGQPEAIDRLREVCLWLKEPEVYNLHDAKLPRGILLSGPPGTGKTLLARALAGEADASMYITTGSAFVEVYVGVGAGRVRALFEAAKQQRKRTNKPVIIFIDEIDAVGGKRSNGPSSNSEREQTLNQLLTEMDGFQKNEGILVIAATNRTDMLDPALKRKGRFDMDVPIDLPDTEGRAAIFRVHSRKKPLSEGLDFNLLAHRTFGFSGADIEAACNEAAVIASRLQIAEEKKRKQELAAKLEAQAKEPTPPANQLKNGTVGASPNQASTTPSSNLPVLLSSPAANNRVTLITNEMFDEAISIVEAGDARRSRLKAMKDFDKRQTAYHELGHAVVNLVQDGDTITKITIMPRGRALGYVQTHSDGDRFSYTDEDMRKRITMTLAGRAAQEIFTGTRDTGASNDFMQANSMAVRMVTEFGMSSLGAIYAPGYGTAQAAPVGTELANLIDREVRQIVADCDAKAREIIKAHKQVIEELSVVLLDKETILGPELLARFKEAQVLHRQEAKEEKEGAAANGSDPAQSGSQSH